MATANFGLGVAAKAWASGSKGGVAKATGGDGGDCEVCPTGIGVMGALLRQPATRRSCRGERSF